MKINPFFFDTKFHRLSNESKIGKKRHQLSVRKSNHVTCGFSAVRKVFADFLLIQRAMKFVKSEWVNSHFFGDLHFLALAIDRVDLF